MAPSEVIAITECPTGVGASFHGLSRGTASLIEAGIIDDLQRIGYDVKSQRPFSPIEGTAGSGTTVEISANGVRDEELALKVNRDIKSHVKASLSTISTISSDPTEEIPFQLILGGVCVNCPAVMSAFHESLPRRKIGVIWFDADADLSLPKEYPGSTSHFAWMAFSHMAMREGALQSMKEFSGIDSPGVSNPSNTVFFGLNTVHQSVVPRNHLTWLVDNNYRIFSSSAISQSVEAARMRAKQALDDLAAKGCDTIIVHVDVDVIDGGEFPLGNIPNYTGITLEQFMAALEVFLQDKRVKGLNLTEMNPDRDTGLVMTKRLVNGVVKCFQARAAR